MEHPIQELMKTAMDNLVRMVDVSTVVGDPVETADGTVIVPVSRLSTGFAAAGGEYGAAEAVVPQDGAAVHPFGGGSGAGVSVQPIGFLVVGPDHVRFLPVDDGALVDRLLDAVPDLLSSIGGMVNGHRAQPDVPDGSPGVAPGGGRENPHREQPEPPPL